MNFQHTQHIGEKIGDFHVLERIGHGAMASVYRALDMQTHRNVALKVPDWRFAEKPDFVKRFSREAQAMALLQHPGIIRIHALEQFENIPFLVMQYVEGQSLAQILVAKGRLELHEAIDYMLQITNAMSFAHERGVIHRDLKPSNILVETGGRTLIADFGISKIISANGFEETLTFVGTPLYMSPEQCGEGRLDLRTDIYSLGIIFYEMLLGKPPFVGATPAEIIKGHLLETPKFPHQGNRVLPPAIVKIIRKMLAKESRDRYSTIKEVADELRSFKQKDKRNSDSLAVPGKPPAILCYLPQGVCLDAIKSTFESAARPFEHVKRVTELVNRVRETFIDAVILGAAPGDAAIFKLAERLRQKTKNPKLQIVLVIQDISRHEVQTAFHSGITDIIAEPDNPSVVTSKLENILQSNSNTPESRRFFRIPLSQTIAMHIESKLLDISEGGMKIATNMPLTIGEVISFNLDPLRQLRFGEVKGKVKWISGNDSNDAFFYQAGIDFLDVSHAERARLRRWISCHQSSHSAPHDFSSPAQ